MRVFHNDPTIKAHYSSRVLILFRRLPLRLRQALCRHEYWPSMRDDGRANVEKCGKCGKSRPMRIPDPFSPEERAAYEAAKRHGFDCK